MAHLLDNYSLNFGLIKSVFGAYRAARSPSEPIAMRPAPRRHLSYASLVLLLAADMLAGVALVLNQWFATMPLATWLLAAGLTAVAMPALLRLADKVFALARASRNVPFPGESFP
ncbi:MAG: hypothetical protein KA391_01455 [Luteimonas sp.]|nr:hypothetical protein [Luteimonas sp.]